MQLVEALPSLRAPAILGASAGLVVGATGVWPDWPFFDHGALLSKLVLAAAARDALGGTLDLLPVGWNGLPIGSGADR